MSLNTKKSRSSRRMEVTTQTFSKDLDVAQSYLHRTGPHDFHPSRWLGPDRDRPEHHGGESRDSLPRHQPGSVVSKVRMPRLTTGYGHPPPRPRTIRVAAHHPRHQASPLPLPQLPPRVARGPLRRSGTTPENHPHRPALGFDRSGLPAPVCLTNRRRTGRHLEYR